jgi:hypothetical protein
MQIGCDHMNRNFLTNTNNLPQSCITTLCPRDRNDWNHCGQNCTGNNVRWLKGANTAGKCPECSYPTPDSMQNRGSGISTSTSSEPKACQGRYVDDSPPSSDTESTAGMLGECENTAEEDMMDTDVSQLNLQRYSFDGVV